MRKLALNVDSLTVESFDAGGSTGGGTVLGHATQFQSCMQYPGTDSNFHLTCEPGLSNDEPSCHYGRGGCSEACSYGSCYCSQLYPDCSDTACTNPAVMTCGGCM